MTGTRWRFRLLVAAALALACLLPPPQGHAEPAPPRFETIAYPGAPPGERRRSLDLYRPAPGTGKPPLLIFIHGGFWLLDDDRYRIGPEIAENLSRHGAAVALLRYRLAPGQRHPAQMEDVAAGIALLLRLAARYGYDETRIFLAGHSAGAHLAALAALDSSYLQRAGVSPQKLAGVICFSGLYDLQPTWSIANNQRFAVEQTFGGDAAARRDASPVRHARADAPPFLILSAAQDFPGFAIDARRFAEALRRSGNRKVRQYMVGNLDHFSLVNWNSEPNPVRGAVLDFMGIKPLAPQLSEWVEAKQIWAAAAPYSTRPLWERPALIRSYPIDERFFKMLLFIYRGRKDELKEWPLQQYHAVDLFPFLDSLPKARVGEGEFLIVTNVRGERLVWQRNQIERHRPVLVVGIDDERNLFRFSTFYHMHAEYSWKPAGRTPLLTMSLGAFLYFLDEPPAALAAQSWHFGLTADSFRRAAVDPLRSVKDVPPDVYEALTFRNGCVYCHTFRGTGSRSHHVEARTGNPAGGFALPLESYPLEVWKTFMFDQESVAKKMGAFPNLVSQSAKQPLFELVNQARQAASASK